MENIKETRQAYSEVHNYIQTLSEEEKEKIPAKLIKFFERERLKNYPEIFDMNNLSDKAVNILAYLFLNYLCEDEDEKNELLESMKRNDARIE